MFGVTVTVGGGTVILGGGTVTVTVGGLGVGTRRVVVRRGGGDGVGVDVVRRMLAWAREESLRTWRHAV
jgi:hypothetical protein